MESSVVADLDDIEDATGINCADEITESPESPRVEISNTFMTSIPTSYNKGLSMIGTQYKKKKKEN